MVGRLTHPMRYDAGTDTYQPVSWDDAFALVGRHLNALPNPDMADFYTSRPRVERRRPSSTRLFAREYGTNNFPDCSNMCHEATSVGLPQSLGVGKGTVLLDDFEKADAILIFGQNPGTNSPRMMTDLRNASRRGCTIMSFNPFRERALERFQGAAEPGGDGDAHLHPDLRPPVPGQGRRRRRPAQGHDEGAGRGRPPRPARGSRAGARLGSSSAATRSASRR